MPKLGFAPGAELAVTALGLGPVGWVAAGLASAVSFIKWFTPDRGNYAKFDRELFPTLSSLSTRTGLDTTTGWFNELVGTDPAGNRKVYGSWQGMGPEWGDLAAAKIMDLGRTNFLWNFQPGSDSPWVLVGPHQTLGSVVYISFETIQAIQDWWNSEEGRILREPQVLEGPEPEIPPLEPSYEPIDPGEVSAPPAPAEQIDPPTTGTPRLPPRGGTRPWWLPQLPGIPRGGGGYPGGYPPGYPGGYPGGPGGGTGIFGGSQDWLYYGAAALLLLAFMKKKNRKAGHGHHKKD